METSECVSRIVPEVNRGCYGIAQKFVAVEWKWCSRIGQNSAVQADQSRDRGRTLHGKVTVGM
jgi:hypothetical protein